MSPRRSASIPWVRVATTSFAYLVATASAVGLTRFGGGAAFLWIANAVLLASLMTTGRRHWPASIAGCWLAGGIAAGLWGLGWSAAPAISLINVAEPLIGASLAIRWGIHRSGLSSIGNLGLFVLAIGVIAPALTGLAGALFIDVVTRTGVTSNFGRWFVGHALGAVTFTPILAQVASGEVRRWLGLASRRQAAEAVTLLLLVVATSAGVFAQSHLPMLFLPILPLMIITFRVGTIGAAAAIVAIATVGAGLTLQGLGPVNLIHAGLGERLQFLQFYLAVTVMTVLPVAADLARRYLLFEQLRDSEARYRLLTENSTDIVLNLDADGLIRYASPSIALLGGYDPHALLGTNSALLVHKDDQESVRAVHRRALAHPSKTFTVEFRGVVAGDAERWFETHTRAVTDDDGTVRGVVSAVRDTSARRLAEAALSRAANTDALTGLCNRRAFDRELARMLSQAAGAPGGSVAIFDLDHFKKINDGFGHTIGDEVLRAFACAAGAQVRGGDMLARIGGEEFGLLFAGANAEQAHLVCERIREALAATVVMAGNWPVRATVSVGVASFAAAERPDSVMRRADRALYVAKDQGRNRSSLAA